MTITVVAERPPGTRRKRRWVSWTLAGFFVAWAIVRLFGIEVGSLVTQLMTLTPYGAAGALVVALLVWRRNRPAAIAALVACAVLAVLVLPRATGVPVGQGKPFRVLSLNMFGRADPDTVVALVRKYHPDVLSALELTPAQVDRLDAAGLKDLMPYRVLEPDYGATGSGLYAALPMTPLTGLFTPIGHNMPAATVTLPDGRPVQVVAVHPNPPLGSMTSEWNASLAALPSASKDVLRVLAGDFNASLDHRAFRDLLSRGYLDAADRAGKALTPTWPNGRRLPPMITIDHILADSRAGVASVEILDVPGTDHRAIYTDLRL
ncbi:endonuclease/exonuclease/phosphatase family protein [Nonomuraea sp. NPDC050556]|uniref:endonuclease/exonuclease/phosphatase family protein n=1 Tax=Nonomuraea sp. NPDC050556 TaxID=3364369 RepID=UPI0037919ED7